MLPYPVRYPRFSGKELCLPASSSGGQKGSNFLCGSLGASSLVINSLYYFFKLPRIQLRPLFFA